LSKSVIFSSYTFLIFYNCTSKESVEAIATAYVFGGGAEIDLEKVEVISKSESEEGMEGRD
jgi:hypothetical protein